MAKSKRNRGCPTASKNNNNSQPNGTISKKQWCANNIDLTQEAIDRHWAALPSQAKSFIHSSEDGMFPLSKLIQFWSASANVECTVGGIAGSICGAMWYLALVHLRLGDFKTARALTINGAFIHQCYNSSIEYIKGQKTGQYISEHQLPYFFRGCTSIQTPDTMKRYIERYLPKEYTQMMTSFANLSSKKHVNQYINQIGDDWQSGKSRSSRNSRTRSTSDADDRQIKITFVDDVDEEERQSFDIGSQTTLKSLFNDYAERRCVSLRLLRFSYSGTLFLSCAGHKTPEDLGIENGDEISVHDMSEKPARKTSISSDDSSQACTLKTNSNKSSNKKKKKKLKTTKKKSTPQPRQQQSQDSIKTLEEYKVDHSKRLTKIHDECSDQFKLIRQRLNNLSISRSKPKKKTAKKKSKSTTSLPSVVVGNPSKEGIGGKAGRTHYVIQVGETSNLYKSTKPSSSSQLSSPQLPTLDLHGYTSEDALVKLNECLEIWFTAAMEGSYPFVRPAVIVCGGGTQTLSEVVEKWIKSNANRVSNAPRSHRLNSSARAA